MFDVAPTELLLVAIVALLVIGPKDLPKAMRFVGHWVGKARGVARQFRSGFDAMVREAELAEMEKKWADENARIMREHPSEPTHALPAPDTAADTIAAEAVIDHVPAPHAADPPHQPDVSEEDPAPVMVEKPLVEPASAPEASAIAPDKAAS